MLLSLFNLDFLSAEISLSSSRQGNFLFVSFVSPVFVYCLHTVGIKLEGFGCETGTAKDNCPLIAAKESGRKVWKVFSPSWVCSLLSVQTSEPPGVIQYFTADCKEL